MAMPFKDKAASIEVVLKLSVLALRSTEQAYESWRDRVFRGLEEFDVDVESGHRTDLQEWLENYEALRTSVLEGEVGERSLSIEDLRSGEERIVEILASWESPSLAKNPSFRKVVISDRESAKIEGLIESGSARMKIRPERLAQNC